MKQFLSVATHLLAVVGIVAVMLAMMAAPGFLDDASSTVPSQAAGPESP